jgi:hypothetical protein
MTTRTVALIALTGLFALATPPVAGQAITQIIDATGDGQGNPLAGARGLTLDRWGNVYVAGLESDNVFQVALDGTITEVMDETGDGLGQPLSEPVSLATDAAGGVYVAGQDSDNVFRIAPDGTIEVVLDAAGDGEGHPLDWPQCVVVGASGDVYVNAFASGEVFRIGTNGTVEVVFTSLFPMKLAVAPSGALFVSDFFDTAYVIPPGDPWQHLLTFSGDGLGNPYFVGSGVAVGRAGTYLVGAQSNNAFRVERGGEIVQIIDGSGDGQGNTLETFFGLYHPAEVIVDRDENAYVAGVVSHNVFRIAPDGTITEIIDATGDGQGNTLMYPEGLAAGRGQVYVAGWGSHNVFRIE